MLKKKLFFFAVFILLVLGLLTFQSIKGKSRFIDFALYPLTLIEKGTSAVVHKIKTVFNAYIFIVGKEEENKRLIDKINELKRDINRYSEIEKENARLSKILELKSERSDYVTAAKIFARDPTNWFQIAWIDKGRDDGISKDMVAVTPVGPVGRVHRVLKGKAGILLITDVNSSVAVRLQQSRIEGILEGRGDDRCNLKYVSRDAEVHIGEGLITSGLDGLYPEGLLIGHVTNVRKEREEVFQTIEVKPVQNPGMVEEVLILRR